MKWMHRFATTAVLMMGLIGSAFAADKVNINTADAAALDQVLINVGPVKAEAIVAYRKEHGAFRSIEQLALVRGIGLKTVEKNRDRIELGTGSLREPVVRQPAPAATRQR